MPRIPDSIRKPTQIIGQKTGTLQNLYSHARELLALQAKVRAMVPGDIYVAAFDDGILHLITPSSALASRLRYHQPKLIETLRRKDKLSIGKLKVTVRPDPIHTDPPQREAIPLSPENAHHMALAAKYIEDDGLRKAMIRLSHRAKDQ
ncbi:MAG: DciA family protein [Pseudomonadales bacterium]